MIYLSAWTLGARAPLDTIETSWDQLAIVYIQTSCDQIVNHHEKYGRNELTLTSELCSIDLRKVVLS